MDFDETYCDLNPDIFCLRHGKKKPMSEYGVRYGGCEDCDGPEPDSQPVTIQDLYESACREREEIG